MKYVVDSNFFIQAHRQTYPLDVALTYWLKIKELAEKGIIISIDKVKDEILIHSSNIDKQDELEKWCHKYLPETFFKASSPFIKEYQSVLNWAFSKKSHFKDIALNEFLEADEADAFLVAFALQDIENFTIVTYERSDINRKSKIKIPEPCNDLMVKYINPIEMFRALGETF
jgi:hypothetical protein